MSEEARVEPLILIVSGPSGSGKSTLVQRILELPGTMPSVSCTTRVRRTTEASGKCYDFVTEAEFNAMVARGEFLEHARVFGKYSYGTPKKLTLSLSSLPRPLPLSLHPPRPQF